MADPGDAAAVWARVQEAAERASSLAWVDLLRLVSLKDGVATVAPQPSKREAIRFVEQPPNRQRLAQLLSAAVGRPVEVRVDLPGPMAATARSEGPSRPRQNDVQDALSSPAVKLALDVFPDAVIVNIQRHEPAGPVADEPEPDTDDEES